jgi:hypothetical protein
MSGQIAGSGRESKKKAVESEATVSVVPASIPVGEYYVYNPSDAVKGWNDGCIVWWREGGHGYSNYMEDAGVFTEADYGSNYPPRDHVWVPAEIARKYAKTRTYCWTRDLPQNLSVVPKWHLTNQHFRRCCLQNAAACRRRPPLTHRHLASIFIADCGWFGRPEAAFFDQLWPFVVAQLNYEGAWPYIIPENVSKERLRYVYRKPEKRDEPHPWRDSPLNTSRENVARCSFCYREHDDPIHVYGPLLEGAR